MTKPTLHRAATTVEDFTGRTLEGIAYRYERPSRVSDDNFRTTYFEEIMKRADAKTLGDREAFPVYRFHDRTRDPAGTVTFERSDNEQALMFRATIDRNAEGDQLLADIEEWQDVSVSYRPLKDTYRTTEHHGRITQRREIRLLELSVAPTGTGQSKGAEILAVRAAGTEPRLTLLESYIRRAKLL